MAKPRVIVKAHFGIAAGAGGAVIRSGICEVNGFSRRTAPDAPNAFILTNGSPGQGRGTNLGPILQPILLIQQSGNQATISWTQPIWMKGVLKSSPTLTNPTWTPVSGVVNNSVTVSIGAANQFFAILK